MGPSLSPAMIAGLIACYFIVLLVISYFTSRKSDNTTFFIAGRKSPWYLVAFGMIGASLSGVTFISIPGVVGGDGVNMGFSYMQMVLGYVLGYIVIAEVLMPIYYKLNLTSIYGFLEQRLGWEAYKTGAAYFLLSRVIGASFRLFLVAIVLQEFVMNAYGIPFWMTVAATIGLIWIYTFRAGIKTIVYTDTLQTLGMLSAVALTVYMITQSMDWTFAEMIHQIQAENYGQVFFFENGWEDPNYFFKQFISGALITIVMTGLDQDMMQKNLSCRNIGEAKKNMYSFTVILVFANLLFLTLGALLYIYARAKGIEIPQAGETDTLFPSIALNHLPASVGVLFVIGLIAAAYSSADSALTSLTTAFCVDFLGFERVERAPGVEKRWRIFTHIGFSILLFSIIVVFNAVNEDAVINSLFKAAGYTYGPILGLFLFGLLLKKRIEGWPVVFICIIAPLLSYSINAYSDTLLGGLSLGFLILAVNGVLTFAGLWIYAKFKK
jgi:Na+/proline symporter